jgi:hypothetical protein
MNLQTITRKMGWLRVLPPALMLALAGMADASGPNIVNIINFIRGVEPRTQVDLVEPVEKQLDLARRHKLPTTWLIQYDALLRPDITDLLKKKMGPDDEIGAWIEVVQPQVEAAGIKWRGRYPWDWHVNVGFTHGYPVEERKKLMDVYMTKFKEIFGKLPKSAGCWIIDAPTLNYLHDEYGIEAACNCKDQSGTDGYTLWGGYWNQAYYPSRLNAYMPAQNADRQLDVPVFRMLGSDPVHQYDTGIGSSWQGVITLEPIYRPGGGDPKWNDWFFDTNFKNPSLAFSYMQAGQENSFGWPAMKDGLIDQYAKLASLRNQRKIRVETLQASAKWFREKYETTPASSIVALEDSKGDANRSIWYESRFYRVNLYWENDQWRIRDLHVFNQDYPERYLEKLEETAVATYDTLPVMDGFHWSKPGDIAGVRAFNRSSGESQPLATKGVPVVKETSPESLEITCDLASGGGLLIRCEPEQLGIALTGNSPPSTWDMEMVWAEGRQPPVVKAVGSSIAYRHEGFSYSLACGTGEVTRNGNDRRITIRPKDRSLTFRFESGNPTGGAGAAPAPED